MQLRFFGWTRRKISSKKKPLDVELMSSPPRRILARLAEAVRVEAVLRGLSNAWRFCKNIERRRKIYRSQIPPRSRKTGDKTRLVAHFLDLVYLDDASSQGCMHIDKSMNEEVHALACCILS